MVIFGGLHKLTNELNDMHAFDFVNQSWINVVSEGSD